MKRKPMNKVGPRTKRRNRATARLRKTVEPTYCELRREGCTVYGIEWAHSKKSHNGIVWEEAARSCRHCHTGPNGIEWLSPGEMEQAVKQAIAGRLGNG